MMSIIVIIATNTNYLCLLEPKALKAQNRSVDYLSAMVVLLVLSPEIVFFRPLLLAESSPNIS